MSLKVGGLFAGTAALERAVQMVFPDATPAWFVEFDASPSAVLAHHYPDVPNYGDVTQVDWSEVEPIDVLTGGSPCQDLSVAGARKGMSEGTRSNLWVNMREAIAQLQPKLVLWENVQGALSARATSESDMEPGQGLLGDAAGGHLRALGRVLGDLASLGYDARWTTLRASDVGAAHHRARVFVVAYPASVGLQTQRLRRRPGAQVAVTDDGELLLPDTADNGHEWPGSARDGRGGSAYGSPRVDVFGKYAPAVARWERVMGRPAPAPAQVNAKGNRQLDARFAEWLMGLPPGWVTDVPGLSRSAQLRMLGNGCVPLQAAAALAYLLSF